jgi:hypothetical protein
MLANLLLPTASTFLPDDTVVYLQKYIPEAKRFSCSGK